MPEHEQLGAGAEPDRGPGPQVPAQGGPAGDRAAATAPAHPGAAPAPAVGDAADAQDGGSEVDGAVAWPDRILPLLRLPTAARPLDDGVRENHPKPEELAAAVSLALRVGELMLACGESAEDVEAAVFAVTSTYRAPFCDPQVTFTRVAISYQPGPGEPPVTAERSVRRPAGDYARLAALFRLVTEITAGGLPAEAAHRRLTAVHREHHRYPCWLTVPSTGLLAGSATLLVSGRADARAWLVFVCAVVAALAGDRLSTLVGRRALPEFYRISAAAAPAAAVGILMSFNQLHLRGSVVIAGGLFAFMPGWPMVAAVQDGLTGFYLTAAARLLEALYLMAGVVVGVTTVLYVGVNNGADLMAQSVPAPSNPALQLAAAVLLTLFFAVLLNTEPAALPAVLVNSAAGWSTYGALVQAGTEPIMATGFAAMLVGLSGQLTARFGGSPALPFVTAALGPLLPGSELYFGLIAFVQGEPEAGLSGVGRATATAMALAIGVSLGHEVARLFLPAPGVVLAGRRPGGRHRR
ncbi:threonine/serine exporter family protein [Kitasatospora sp. NPDC096077]|uniref:threonine/serine ThrE exporter family protein n=1 Tax=Kitasatospora sp. NPDC096077 TaxID=3155544 RepID=UPI0033177226